jgi:hypothetical protein
MILVAWDTDQIKRYVFATPKLREIRGASAILDDLNENQIPEIVGRNRMVYAGGGSAMAQVADQVEAENLIQEVERLYRSRTKSAEITGAWIEMNDGTVSFGEYAQRLNFRLRTRKDEKARRRSLLTAPVLKACHSCGQFPAELESEADLICHSCEIKRRESRGVRDGGESMSRLSRLLAYANAKGQWPGVSVQDNAPREFNQIGEAARPGGYIGFVYCDANRMGALLSELRDLDSFKVFSEGTRDVLREVTFDGLCRHFPDLRSDLLPFEIIFIGGDDVVLVVAADKAIDIAIYLCREFERRSESVLKEAGVNSTRQRLSMSAAVVLSHASLPIYHLQAIAEDLLHSAKRQSLNFFEKQDNDVGCIDFHVVTASASDLPSIMRPADWEREEDPVSLRLTERPYSANELDELANRIRALKATGFPSSKLQMLFEAIVDQSMTRARSQWAFVAGRARRNKERSKDQLTNLAAFFDPAADPSLLPWRELEPNVLTTPIVDVAELYDFIR